MSRAPSWPRCALRAALVVGLVLSSACSLAPTSSTSPDVAAARLVPAEAWLFGEVNLRPGLSQLAGAAALASAFTSQPGWDQFANVLSATAGSGVNISSDVLPLLDGEVGVAAMGGVTTAQPPDIVALAHSSDPDRLVHTLEPTASSRQDPRGAHVYAVRGSAPVATLKHWLVVATSPALLDATLNRIAGTGAANSLQDTQHFQTLLARLPADRLGFEYTDLGAVLKQLGSSLPNAAELPPDSRALLSDLDSQVAASFAAAPRGLDIRVEGLTRVTPGLANQVAAAAQEADPAEAFAHLPAETLVALGTGLPPLGPETDALVSETLQRSADQLDAPELASLDLHPSQWLGDAFALGGSRGTLSEPNGQPDLFVVAQVSDAEAAQADLDSVTELLPPKSASPLTFDGVPGAFLQVDLGNARPITYGLADGWLYGVSGDAESVITAASSGGIEDNPRYAALRDALGGDRVNVFADVRGLEDLTTGLLSRSARAAYQSNARLLVAPIAFFGGGQRSDPNGDTHAHFILGIQQP